MAKALEMVEEKNSLYEWVRVWAKGNLDDIKNWITELNGLNFMDIEDLEEMAEGLEDWDSFVNDHIKSRTLRAKLERWKRCIYDKKCPHSAMPNGEALMRDFHSKSSEVLNHISSQFESDDGILFKTISLNNPFLIFLNRRFYSPSEVFVTRETLRLYDLVKYRISLFTIDFTKIPLPTEEQIRMFGSDAETREHELWIEWHVWNVLLIGGLSGTGKSVAISIVAALVQKFQGCDVIWFRTPPPKIQLWTIFESLKRDSVPLIVFVDQVQCTGDELADYGHSVSSFSDKSCLVLCLSENAILGRVSSSEQFTFHQFSFDPKMDFEIFKKLTEEHDEIKNQPESESGALTFDDFRSISANNLDFIPQTIDEMYKATSGHFNSFTQCRFGMLNQPPEEVWNDLIELCIEDIKGYFSERQPDHTALFRGKLQHILLEGNFDEIIDVWPVVEYDRRFVHKGRIFSLLFAQSLRRFLLSSPQVSSSS
jgi:hypothetical protein